MEIIDLMTDDANPTCARENAYQNEEISRHSRHGRLVVLHGPAILQALRPEGQLGKIKIVCFDDDRVTLAGIKEEAIFGTVAQQAFEYGYQAVQPAAKILRGDPSVVPESKTVLIPTVVIQSKDIDEYSKKLNQLLGGTPN